MLVSLFDLGCEHQALRDSLRLAFDDVLDASSFILGTTVETFEKRVAAYLGCPHAVGLSNGSDALYVALLALGIGPGDEVITTPFTFVATAEAILRVGATPVFADIDPDSFCLCPASTKRMRTSRTKAVLPVHLYGHPGQVLELRRYCESEGLCLVEDACQAFGAKAEGQAVGTLGSVGIFSFFPTKPLGGFGDGGLLVTASETLAKHVKSLRAHGVTRRDCYETLGGNYRLDALQAALLSVKLGAVDSAREKRAGIARRYIEQLRNSRYVVPPALPMPHLESAWSLFTVRVPEHRDALAAHLVTHGIESKVYYPSLLSSQPLFSSTARSDRLKGAECASRDVLSLPIYGSLTPAAEHHVLEAIHRFKPGL